MDASEQQALRPSVRETESTSYALTGVVSLKELVLALVLARHRMYGSAQQPEATEEGFPPCMAMVCPNPKAPLLKIRREDGEAG